MSVEDALELARSELVANASVTGDEAIREYLRKLDAVAFPFEVGPRDIAEMIVDGECARGDYEGCSPDLELAFDHYCSLAERAIEGGRTA